VLLAAPLRSELLARPLWGVWPASLEALSQLSQHATLSGTWEEIHFGCTKGSALVGN